MLAKLITLLLLLTLAVQAQDLYIENWKFTYPVETIDGKLYTGMTQLLSALDAGSPQLSQLSRQSPPPKTVNIGGRDIPAVWSQRGLLIVPIQDTAEALGFAYKQSSRGLEIGKPGGSSLVYDAAEAKQWVQRQKSWLNTHTKAKGSADFEVSLSAEVVEVSRGVIVLRSQSSRSSHLGGSTYMVTSGNLWEKRVYTDGAKIFPGLLRQLKPGDNVLVVTAPPDKIGKKGQYATATVQGYLIAPTGSW